MTDFEIRRIDRAIENSLREQADFDNATTEGDNAMIAETEVQAIARAQHWDDVCGSITVAHSKTPGQRQHEKQRLAHQDRLDAGRTAYALQCRYEFDREACAEQFSRECI